MPGSEKFIADHKFADVIIGLFDVKTLSSASVLSQLTYIFLILTLFDFIKVSVPHDYPLNELELPLISRISLIWCL